MDTIRGREGKESQRTWMERCGKSIKMKASRGRWKRIGECHTMGLGWREKNRLGGIGRGLNSLEGEMGRARGLWRDRDTSWGSEVGVGGRKGNLNEDSERMKVGPRGMKAL